MGYMERKNIARFLINYIENDCENPADEITWLVMNLEDDAFQSLVELKEKQV